MSGVSSWVCLGHYLGHVWSIIWSMSAAFLGPLLGHLLGQSKISALLHASLVPNISHLCFKDTEQPVWFLYESKCLNSSFSRLAQYLSDMLEEKITWCCGFLRLYYW